jgi:hypothetical protein
VRGRRRTVVPRISEYFTRAEHGVIKDASTQTFDQRWMF